MRKNDDYGYNWDNNLIQICTGAAAEFERNGKIFKSGGNDGAGVGLPGTGPWILSATHRLCGCNSARTRRQATKEVDACIYKRYHDERIGEYFYDGVCCPSTIGYYCNS